MIRASFKTHPDVELQYSKYKTDVLRTPFSINVTDISDKQRIELMERFVKLGALTFGAKQVDINMSMSILHELIEENEKNYGSDRHVYMNVGFNKDKTLRMNVSGNTKEAGRTIYAREQLIELLDSLDVELPLTLEESTRNMRASQGDGPIRS